MVSIELSKGNSSSSTTPIFLMESATFLGELPLSAGLVSEAI